MVEPVSSWNNFGLGIEYMDIVEVYLPNTKKSASPPYGCIFSKAVSPALEAFEHQLLQSLMILVNNNIKQWRQCYRRQTVVDLLNWKRNSYKNAKMVFLMIVLVVDNIVRNCVIHSDFAIDLFYAVFANCEVTYTFNPKVVASISGPPVRCYTSGLRGALRHTRIKRKPYVLFQIAKNSNTFSSFQVSSKYVQWLRCDWASQP